MLNVTKVTYSRDLSKDYQVKINGEMVDVFTTRVSKMPFNRDWPNKQRPLEQSELASVISFSSDKSVFIEVEPNRKFSEVVIRPLSDGVKFNVNNSVITFTLTKPGQYVLELDGIHLPLFIFFDPYKNYNVDINDKNVLYFSEGVHYVGEIKLKDNQIVYLDRNALVYGSIVGVGVKNVKVIGNGILDGNYEDRTNNHFIFPFDFSRVYPKLWGAVNHVFSIKPDEKLLPPSKKPYVPGTGSKLYRNKKQFNEFLSRMLILKSGIHLYKCENVLIDGITVNGVAGLSNTIVGSSNVHYDNVKVIGMWKHNNDGIDFYNCHDCSVKNCFIRAFDDCICMKGQLGWDTESTYNMTVENCIVWTDWSHGLEVGVDTVAPKIYNIVYRDCDCLHPVFTPIDVACGTMAKISNVTFSDIRVEYSKYDQLYVVQKSDDDVYVERPGHVEVFSSSVGDPLLWAGDNIAGEIDGVLLDNVQLLGDNNMEFPGMWFKGLDKEHGIKNVTIKDISFNGKKITDINSLKIEKNDFVKNIKLI